MRTRADSTPCVAALPLAAGFTVRSRWLPIRFEYRENPLGSSRWRPGRYPLQQETFWLVRRAGLGAARVGLHALSARRALQDAGQPAFVALGLVLALWLPGAGGAAAERRPLPRSARPAQAGPRPPPPRP
jgi:hypothetical protein